MAEIEKFVRVVQRKRFGCSKAEGHILPLLEPAFMIDTHLSFEERLKLFNLAAALPIGFIVCEIGSYLGASTSFLAAAATLGQGHVHAIDTWQNDAMPNERAEDTWLAFLDNIDRFRTWVTPHRGRASQVVADIPPLHMLFIDGDHSYEETLANLRDYVPKLLPGGVVAMHDFDCGTVRQAMGEYFSNRQLEDLGLTHTLRAVRVV